MSVQPDTSHQHKVLARTTSVCPFCLKSLPADIVETDSAIYLRRCCVEHGEHLQNISNHPSYYKGLRDYYVGVTGDLPRQTRYLLFITGECSLECPVCFYGKGDFNEMTLDEVGQAARVEKGTEMVIFGKEPTCHEGLPRIIELLKKTQNSVSLYTNGIRIGDRDYLHALKRSGVDKVYLQFDGFRQEIYSRLRNSGLLDAKLKALENLKHEHIATVMNVTLVKDNEGDVKKILDYAVEHDFVRTVNITCFIRSGSGREFLPGCSLMPDDAIDIVEKQTGGAIARDKIYLFQKLLYAYMSFLTRRTCPYIQYFWIYRDGKGYVPIDRLINLKGLEPILDRYKQLFNKNSLCAKLYLLLFLPWRILNLRSMRPAAEFFKVACSHILKLGEYSDKSSRFIQVIFSTACDPYKADFQIAERCHIGIIYKDRQGVLRRNDENGIYLLTHEAQGGLTPS